MVLRSCDKGRRDGCGGGVSLPLVLWLNIVVLCFVCGHSLASAVSDDAFDGAVTYLLSKQSEDGSWSEADRQVIDSIEVIKALERFSYRPDVQAAINKSLSFVAGLEDTNYDVLARRFSVLADTASDADSMRSALLSAQNADGGWAFADSKQSDVLDTILAADAFLRDSGAESQEALRAARDFLVDSQDVNTGRWPLADEEAPSDIARTAMGLIVLKDMEKAGLGISSAANAVRKARDFLEAEVEPDNPDISCVDIALAWRGLLRVREPCDVDGYLVRLLTSRGADGSWGDDVFTTAVVLQALGAARPAEAVETADLAVYSNYIGFSPPEPNTGQSVEIKAMITNEGGVSATGFYVDFYNGEPNAGGQLIGQPYYIGAMAPGSSAGANVTYEGTGDLYDEQVIVVVVDANNDVTEVRCSNNYAWKVLAFDGGLPDLEIDDSSGIKLYDIEGNVLEGDPCAYQPIAIVAEMTNEGAKTDVGFDVKMEDLNDSSVHGTIRFEGGLAHNQVAKAGFMVALSSGGHTIKITVDESNDVSEGDETNNTASEHIDVGPYGGPSGDLPELEVAAEDINLSETDVLPGDEITITVTVHNTDTTDSNGFYVLLSDGNPYAGGYFIESVYVGGLAGGAEKTIGPVSYDVVYNTNGNEIFVLADSNGDVCELNKVNNLASKRLNIPDLPDLATSPELIRFSHTNLVGGRSVRVFATIRNIGDAEASNVSVKFARVDGGVYYVFGEDIIQSIASRAAAQAETVWYPAAGVDYNVAVLVDYEGAIAEADEQNNIAEKTCVCFDYTANEPNITLYLDNAPNDAFGTYDYVRVDVNVDANYGAGDDFFVTVWGQTPEGDFFWPAMDSEGGSDCWSFSTGPMKPGSGYFIKAAVVDMWGFNIVQEAAKEFEITEEIGIGTPTIDTGQRYLRLGKEVVLSPVVRVYSRSNVTFGANLTVELYEPNDPNDPNTQAALWQWYAEETLVPGELWEVELGPYDCDNLIRSGMYTIKAMASNINGPETSDHCVDLPVVGALGLDVSKSLEPEYLNPTDYARAEVEIVIESTGGLYENSGVDVVLVIDKSGSMCLGSHEPDVAYMDYAKSAATGFAERILDGDGGHKVGVVAFAGEPDRSTEVCSVTSSFDDINDFISAIEPMLWEGTDIKSAIDSAAGLLGNTPFERKRVAILLTDGQDTVPTYNYEQRKQEIYYRAHVAWSNHRLTIFTVGLGEAHDAELLVGIAEAAGGSYYPCGVGTVEKVYEEIYETITSCGMEDIVITDTVSCDSNATVLDTGSINPTPISAALNADGNEYTITWQLSLLEVDERFSFGYEVELYDLLPNENRLVNKYLGVTVYDIESQERMVLELGEQYVKVTGASGLGITADKEEYEPGQSAELVVTFEAPDALEHAVFGTYEHFEQGRANDVDVDLFPGSVVLARNNENRQYVGTGTLNLIADAGSSSYWGAIDFTGWYPGQYEMFDRTNNYVLSNKVADVQFYRRATQGDAWWADSGASWYAELDDTLVGNALTTEEGWIVLAPLTGRLDSKMDSNDFSIEEWGRADSNAVLFYRGNGDANHLSIYAEDDQLYVDCNIWGFEPNVRSIELALDSNDWHYVVLTVDDGNAMLYVDGNEPSDYWAYDTDVMARLKKMPILIGGEIYPVLQSDYHTEACRIDEVSIYNRVLEPNEIGGNYARALNYHQPSDIVNGLVGYWDFEPGPQDQSELELGGRFAEAWLDEASDYDLRRISGRGWEPNFPEESYVIATARSIDIIDADAGALWMRFPTDRAFLWCQDNVKPGSIFACDGRIYVGQDGHDEGLAIIDFKADQVRLIQPLLTDGIMAHWKLDDSSGTTAADSSGNNYSANLMNDLSFDSNSVEGVLGSGLALDGIGDYVNCPDISFDANGQYTYSLWLKNSDKKGTIISDDDYVSGTGFALESQTDQIALFSNTGGWVFLRDFELADGVWHHIGLTYCGQDGKGSGALYVDGEPEDTYSDIAFANSAGNLRIGMQSMDLLYDYFKGAIDDVRVYSRVLGADGIRRIYARGNMSANATIKDRFLTQSNGVYAFVDEPVLRDGHIHDVTAVKTADANYIAVGTNRGAALVKNESYIYHSKVDYVVTDVFLTDTNDLYFVTYEPNGDSLYAVYDIESISADDFEADEIYGYRDQNEPNLPAGRINDLFVVSGDAVDGNNVVYVATGSGLVRIEENQSNRPQSIRSVYTSCHCSDFVNILAGDSNDVTAVYADANELWVVTSDGSGDVLSIVELSADKLVDSLSASSQPKLPNAPVSALDYGLVGTSGGAMAFEPDLVSPISVRGRCIYSDNPQEPNEAVSEWTEWVTEPGRAIMDVPLAEPNSSRPLTRSQYLELEVKLTRGDDAYVSPVLEAISVGYTPQDLAIDVSVQDAGGKRVAEVDSIAISDDEMYQVNSFVRHFNTAGVIPGGYNAVAELVDTITDEILTADSDDFVISGPVEPNEIYRTILRGQITTDRRFYDAGETVVITSELFNESDSIAVEDLDMCVWLKRPNNEDILPEPWSYTIFSLQPGAMDVRKFYYTIGAELAPGPDYGVLQVLQRDDDEHPMDRASFEIVSSCESLSAIGGAISINRPRITLTNRVVNMSITATNTGNVDLTDVRLWLKVLDMSEPNEPETIMTRSLEAVDLTLDNPSTVASSAYTPVDLEPGTYPVVLSATFKCGDSNEVMEAELAMAAFRIVEQISSIAGKYIIIDLGVLDGPGS